MKFHQYALDGLITKGNKLSVAIRIMSTGLSALSLLYFIFGVTLVRL